jgi:hypothetical protein
MLRINACEHKNVARHTSAACSVILRPFLLASCRAGSHVLHWPRVGFPDRSMPTTPWDCSSAASCTVSNAAAVSSLLSMLSSRRTVMLWPKEALCFPDAAQPGITFLMNIKSQLPEDSARNSNGFEMLNCRCVTAYLVRPACLATLLLCRTSLSCHAHCGSVISARQYTRWMAGRQAFGSVNKLKFCSERGTFCSPWGLFGALNTARYLPRSPRQLQR